MTGPTPPAATPDVVTAGFGTASDDERARRRRAAVAAAARSGALRPAEPPGTGPSWWPRSGLRWRLS